MAVAVTGCTTDPSRDWGRRWSKHRWNCATCSHEVRFYAGVGWHHYTQRFPMASHAPEVTVEIVECPGTSMPPRRALMELEAELARTPVRPRLYLVPPPATPAGPLAA